MITKNPKESFYSGKTIMTKMYRIPEDRGTRPVFKGATGRHKVESLNVFRAGVEL